MEAFALRGMTLVRIPFAALVTLSAMLWMSHPRLIAAATDDEAVRSISSALRAKSYQHAFELAQTARREWPKDVRILVLEGMALKGLGRESEALARFESALQISPDYIPALEAASEIEYKTGSAAATTRLERLLTLRPNEETAHAMLAVLAWKRGDCATAVKHFGESKSAIAAQPDAQYGFGACLMKLKRTQEALAVFDRSVAAHPDDRRTRYALAVLLLDTRRTREAIDALKPLVDAKDPDPTALELSSTAYEAMGDTPKAVALLREAIVRDPGNGKLYLDFASLSFAHQSFQVGIDMINAGLSRSPDSAPLYLARGVLHVQLAEFDQADRDFDRAERIDPKQALGGVVRGLSQIQRNNLDQALVTVRTQLKDHPKDEFPYYVLAELLSKQGAQPGSAEFDEALHAALEAVRLKPDFTLARDVLSRLYLQAGETDNAIEQCRLALRDNPSDEMALYRLIRALQSRGGKDAAEVATLLKRFTELRDEVRRREAEESKYRLVEQGAASR
jgi:tetratricopeptide (TPR) repeat protein